MRVDFFNISQEYLESRILEAGDVILLATGGHGFEVLEEIEMIEVKQGPYAGDWDKTRFIARLPAQLRFGPDEAERASTGEYMAEERKAALVDRLD